MRNAAVAAPRPDIWFIDHLRRRAWPMVVAVGYVALGLAYTFRWGSVVRHTPSLWISPVDLSGIYRASSALAHGHLSAIYQAKSGFLALPGFLVVLAPLSALSNVFHTTFVEIFNNHHLVTHPQYLVSHTSSIWDSGTITSGAHQAIEYSVQPQWFAFVTPYILVVACSVLFACDALAERLHVVPWRRALLCVTEAVMLWPVTVLWGHPEDALALALAIYAVTLAMDDRFIGAGWLFGAALAVQPLVVVMFPILLVLGGRARVLRLVVQGLVPAAVVTVGPLVAGFHATLHDVVTQPALPDLQGNHQTPWTFLAPRLAGRGSSRTVGGGPTRVIALVLAAALGWWARRWRQRPEMLAWAAALALALRAYTESVMTAYYVWPALAVALIVAARGSSRRFGVAIALAIATTIVAQWQLSLYPWWIIDIAGVTGVLVAAARPHSTELEEQPPQQGRVPTAVVTQSRAGGATSKTKKAQAAKRKTARNDRKRSARRGR